MGAAPAALQGRAISQGQSLEAATPRLRQKKGVSGPAHTEGTSKRSPLVGGASRRFIRGCESGQQNQEPAPFLLHLPELKGKGVPTHSAGTPMQRTAGHVDTSPCWEQRASTHRICSENRQKASFWAASVGIWILEDPDQQYLAVLLFVAESCCSVRNKCKEFGQNPFSCPAVGICVGISAAGKARAALLVRPCQG